MWYQFWSEIHFSSIHALDRYTFVRRYTFWFYLFTPYCLFQRFCCARRGTTSNACHRACTRSTPISTGRNSAMFSPLTCWSQRIYHCTATLSLWMYPCMQSSHDNPSGIVIVCCSVLLPSLRLTAAQSRGVQSIQLNC